MIVPQKESHTSVEVFFFMDTTTSGPTPNVFSAKRKRITEEHSLKSVEVELEVRDHVATVVSTLNYENKEDKPLEAERAQQRAGRAGRTSAGNAFESTTRNSGEVMPEYTVPEIQRTSLTQFPYPDCPEERFILEALKQLYQFDAIDRRGRVTRLGELMVEFPLHPGLTRALLKAASLGCQDLLLPVAAMLSVENIFIRPGHPEKQKEADQQHKALAAKSGSMNDFATLLSVFQSCQSSDRPSAWCKDHWVHWRALKSAFSVETQLRDILLRLQKRDFPEETFDGNKSELFRRCLCSGYFTNVARRSIGKVFCTMDGHGSMVHIHPASSLFDQEGELNWIIFHDVLVTSRMYVRTACPIRYEWVKDLLPKLHEVDVYELSSVAREEVTEEEMKKWESRKQPKDHQVSTEDVMKKLEKRNDETAVGDARAVDQWTLSGLYVTSCCVRLQGCCTVCLGRSASFHA
ncbi:hypothetical protein NQZ68_027217 [Dissostichus eleginoides]|nr:hypothetical protein NQZ68_027217 [Dissostichus eleginoides]